MHRWAVIRSSLVLADGNIYATNDKGVTTVFLATPEKFESVAAEHRRILLRDAGDCERADFPSTGNHLYRGKAPGRLGARSAAMLARPQRDEAAAKVGQRVSCLNHLLVAADVRRLHFLGINPSG